MHPIITSPQNPKIKNLLALEKARDRKEQNVFVVEGVREITLAIEGKYRFQSVYFCPAIISDSEIRRQLRIDEKNSNPCA